MANSPKQNEIHKNTTDDSRENHEAVVQALQTISNSKILTKLITAGADVDSVLMQYEGGESSSTVLVSIYGTSLIMEDFTTRFTKEEKSSIEQCALAYRKVFPDCGERLLFTYVISNNVLSISDMSTTGSRQIQIDIGHALVIRLLQAVGDSGLIAKIIQRTKGTLRDLRICATQSFPEMSLGIVVNDVALPPEEINSLVTDEAVRVVRDCERAYCVAFACDDSDVWLWFDPEKCALSISDSQGSKEKEILIYTAIPLHTETRKMDSDLSPEAKECMDYWMSQMNAGGKYHVDLFWLFENIQNAALPMKDVPLIGQAAKEALEVLTEQRSTSFSLTHLTSGGGAFCTMPIEIGTRNALTAALGDIVKSYQQHLPAGLEYQIQTTVSIAACVGKVLVIPVVKLR